MEHSRDVRSRSDLPFFEHDGRAPEERREVAHDAGQRIQAAGAGRGPDTAGRCHDIEFRDARRTLIVIASGPSALGTLRSTDAWRHWPAIAVSDSWRLNHHATALYAADGRWWSAIDGPTGLSYVRLAREFFRGSLWTCDEPAAREHGLNHIGIERAGGLSTTQGTIRTGGQVGNSGAQAINLGYLFGARRFVLVGFDMRRDAVDGKPDQVHWFGDHPKSLTNTPPFDHFIRGMGELAADLHRHGIEVVNCSQRSALPYWRKASLADALQQM